MFATDWAIIVRERFGKQSVDLLLGNVSLLTQKASSGQADTIENLVPEFHQRVPDCSHHCPIVNHTAYPTYNLSNYLSILVNTCYQLVISHVTDWRLSELSWILIDYHSNVNECYKAIPQILRVAELSENHILLACFISSIHCYTSYPSMTVGANSFTCSDVNIQVHPARAGAVLATSSHRISDDRISNLVTARDGLK
ncbi:hypothetical protein T265_01058 [Opisthorchis viverrini]|uniref:Uncharacterized protein n=1 Tax=Opisthorchis viverrini TaxID=6198 RepID=A0A075A0S5_OPIVI|nr:hypothetical protein T265_01058 [Opisthorchis viverrini]KER32966.1 hypothetical protein T265_01058 [Opisthorchis viverrini]